MTKVLIFVIISKIYRQGNYLMRNFLNKLNKTIMISLFGLALAFTPNILASNSSFAVTPEVLSGGIAGGAAQSKGVDVPTTLFGNAGIFTQVTNILLFLIGVLSVIMLIFGGLRYVISGGNSSAVTSAKNTILYAIVGLIVAILAYAIVNFVINTFVSEGGSAAPNSSQGTAPTNV